MEGLEMALPLAITEFLNENAERDGQAAPGDTDNLFKSGILDSFALVDFVGLLEEHCGIKIPDSDVNPAHFLTIKDIERYVQTKRGN